MHLLIKPLIWLQFSFFLGVLIHLFASSAISDMAQQHVHVGYKGTSIGISVTTKMIHIDSTKLHQKAFWGEALKSHNNPWDTHRGMQCWPASKDGDIAVLV